MRQNENFDKAIERLLLIQARIQNREADGYKSFGSIILLFKEYCRRMALWSEALSSREGWPMFDVVSRINPSWEINDDRLSNLLIEKGMTIFSPRSRDIIKRFIHWESYKDKLEVQQYDLPAPYEPAIVLFERGGDIHRDGGRFEILTARLHPVVWEDHYKDEPFVSLDAATLDQEDQKFNEKYPQFGY